MNILKGIKHTVVRRQMASQAYTQLVALTHSLYIPAHPFTHRLQPDRVAPGAR
jgi:hypothetical protein